jgi:hypothetical protein
MSTFAHITLEGLDAPLTLAWPATSYAAACLHFDHAVAWRGVIAGLGIDRLTPEITQQKLTRAQTLYLLGSINFSLIKAGELAALIALELAVMDCYGGELLKRKCGFGALLKHMVIANWLTDSDILMVVHCDGTAIGQLVGDVHPTLPKRRNTLAHGDPFHGLPTAGLLEFVRDLIDYPYSDCIAKAASLGALA